MASKEGIKSGSLVVAEITCLMACVYLGSLPCQPLTDRGANAFADWLPAIHCVADPECLAFVSPDVPEQDIAMKPRARKSNTCLLMFFIVVGSTYINVVHCNLWVFDYWLVREYLLMAAYEPTQSGLQSYGPYQYR